MKKLLLILLACSALIMPLAACGEEEKHDRADDDIDWQYMSADETWQKVDGGEPIIVLDTMVDDVYEEAHIKGAYHVPCFPLDTEEKEERLVSEVKNLQGDEPIAIVCKTGNKVAKRAISILTEEGIDPSRLYIIEGGRDGWPHPTEIGDN